MEKIIQNIVIIITFLFALSAPTLTAQQGDNTSFKQEELEQLLAPIALYPDSLISQILMASTYPLEIVQAQRWAEDNKGLSGETLTAALEKKNWDPSIKSLVNFPDVLNMMSEKLDWTQNLGDAFLAQQKEVLDTVQKLRQKAKDVGTLKTTEQQVVQDEQQVIAIEPADEEIVYVPIYDPLVVYGGWPYPAYPPYYWYPPWYHHPTPYYYGRGFALGAAWGYAWGSCDWHNGDLDIDIDRNLDINHNINRDRYLRNYDRDGRFDQNRRGKWEHNPDSRRGVAYRDTSTAQRYNRASSANAIQSREAYRGRADQGRQNLNRDSINQLDSRQSTAQRRDTGRDLSQRSTAGSRPDRQQLAQENAERYKNRQTANRDMRNSGSSSRGSAFQDVNRGSATRNYSSRGQVSRQSMSRPSGGSRGGGGMRGGGGRR